MTVTAHIVEKDSWRNINRVLDVVELLDPIHSSTYLYTELTKITDTFDITKAIISITHDNASVNDALLDEFKVIAEERFELMNDADQSRFFLRFKASSGRVRCSAHILNLTVQDG